MCVSQSVWPKYKSLAGKQVLRTQYKDCVCHQSARRESPGRADSGNMRYLLVCIFVAFLNAVDIHLFFPRKFTSFKDPSLSRWVSANMAMSSFLSKRNILVFSLAYVELPKKMFRLFVSLFSFVGSLRCFWIPPLLRLGFFLFFLL